MGYTRSVRAHPGAVRVGPLRRGSRRRRDLAGGAHPRRAGRYRLGGATSAALAELRKARSKTASYRQKSATLSGVNAAVGVNAREIEQQAVALQAIYLRGGGDRVLCDAEDAHRAGNEALARHVGDGGRKISSTATRAPVHDA